MVLHSSELKLPYYKKCTQAVQCVGILFIVSKYLFESFFSIIQFISLLCFNTGIQIIISMKSFQCLIFRSCFYTSFMSGKILTVFFKFLQCTGFTYICISQIVFLLNSNIKILESFFRFFDFIGTNAAVVSDNGVLIVCLCQVGTEFCKCFLVIFGFECCLSFVN